MAVSFVLKTDNGEVLTIRNQAVEALRDYWSNIFGTINDQCSVHDLCQFYMDDFPPAMDFGPLPDNTIDDIKAALRKMARKAGGPDGWTTDLILLLPDLFVHILHRFIQFLHKCEANGSWPPSLTHRAVRFLPKKKTGTLPGLGDTRPISIGPVIYRVWSAVRLRHLSSGIKRLLDRHQILDVYDGLVSLHQEYPDVDYPFGACLVFRLLRHGPVRAHFSSAGPSVFGLYAAGCPMECSYSLVCFGDAVSSRPIVNPLGLPQGDPWSPCALMLCLLLPLRRQFRSVGDARAFLYLDDRTIIAPSLPSLQQALGVWDDFCRLTRARTNAVKGSSGGHESVDLQQVFLLGLLRGYYLDTSCPVGFAPAFAHNFRSAWRVRLFDRWLSSNRRDAGFARSAGVSVSVPVVDSLRSFCAQAVGHERQVVCGGVSVEAHRGLNNFEHLRFRDERRVLHADCQLHYTWIGTTTFIVDVDRISGGYAQQHLWIPTEKKPVMKNLHQQLDHLAPAYL
eukprot:s1562_g10.t1